MISFNQFYMTNCCRYVDCCYCCQETSSPWRPHRRQGAKTQVHRSPILWVMLKYRQLFCRFSVSMLMLSVLRVEMVGVENSSLHVASQSKLVVLVWGLSFTRCHSIFVNHVSSHSGHAIATALASSSYYYSTSAHQCWHVMLIQEFCQSLMLWYCIKTSASYFLQHMVAPSL